MMMMDLALLFATLLGSADSFATRVRSPEQAGDICKPGAALETSNTSARYFWSNKNRDAACTGAAPYSAPRNLTGGPSWSWKDKTASVVTSHPCIDGEKNIYLVHRNGMVRKYNSSGQLQWANWHGSSTQFAQVLVGGCVIKDGSLYVGLATGHVMSIDMASGDTNWRVQAALSTGLDSWSLVAHNQIVLTVGRSADFYMDGGTLGGNNLLIALDAHTGRKLWTFKPRNPIFNFIGSFVDSPPSILFADYFGIPHRVALCDGSLLWRNNAGRFDGWISMGGAIAEPRSGLLFVTGNIREVDKDTNSSNIHGTVMAYDVEDGTLLWQHQAAMPANSAPVVGELHSQAGNTSVVVAIGESPGLPDKSAEETGFYMDGRPVGAKSQIYALDAATGSRTSWKFTPPVHKKPHAEGDRTPWHMCMPDSWSNAAIGGDGTVYVGHMSGRLFSLRDLNGDGALSPEKGEVSEYFGGRCYKGSPGLAPGMLVATPCDGIHVFLEA